MAQPGAQPDGPVRIFSSVTVGAARRLADTLGVYPMRDYGIQLDARNEGLRYVDEFGAYRFDLVRNGDVWAVAVPPTIEPELSPAELSPDGEARMLSRVSAFLSRIWWLGIWPKNYRVQFVPRKNA
jgi:hypothetical protein